MIAVAAVAALAAAFALLIHDEHVTPETHPTTREGTL